jgi:sterol desaturase/sphingolipid hydroxylase (fatty acid hydroxylase superfamily)
MAGLAALAFVLIAALETWQQRTSARQSAGRWVTNFALFGLEQLFTLAWVAVLAGVVTSVAGPSPLGGWTNAWPGWIAFVLAIGVLDATTYVSHVLNHIIPPLWRLHAVHHADQVLDVSTTVRHHPLEVVPTATILSVCAWLFDLTTYVPAYAAVAFMVQSIAHADLRLPRRAMRLAGLVFVTPELHALHHSRHRAETNSNYGQLLSVWDRMFGTLLDGSRSGPITVGLDAYASARFGGLLGALTQPFRRPDVTPAD